MTRFWSSVTLTGNETAYYTLNPLSQFWSSVTLTGNETMAGGHPAPGGFCDSVTLTEHETECEQAKMALQGATAVDGQAAS